MSTTPDREGWWWGTGLWVDKGRSAPRRVESWFGRLSVDFGDGCELEAFEWSGPCPSAEQVAVFEEKAAGFDRLYASLLGVAAAQLDADVAVGSRLAGAMGAIEALTANVATLVEQLANAEARCQAWGNAVAEETAAADASDILRQQAEQLAREYLARAEAAEEKLAGAAQPVVEPRDGRPDENRAHLIIATDPGGYRIELMAPMVYFATLEGAKAARCQYAQDIAAGYAPHPSGTEGPTWTRIRDALVKRLADEAGEYAVDEEAHVGLHRAVELLRTTGMVKLALSDAVASPPDGTAPERAAYPCSSCGEMIPLDHACMLARDGSRRHAGKCSPSSETGRLRALIYRMRFAMAVWAQDEDNSVHGDACDAYDDASRLFGLKTTAQVDAERDATRPPDGMPGEPECDCDMDEPGLSTQGCPVHDRPAAPPTVPGEPPTESFADELCDEFKGREGEPLAMDLLRSCGRILTEERGSFRVRGRLLQALELLAAPPTPPLTPERAPLDEAAVRVERLPEPWTRQSEFLVDNDDHAMSLSPDGACIFLDDGNGRVFALPLVCIDALRSGPRRSEGAEPA